MSYLPKQEISVDEKAVNSVTTVDKNTNDNKEKQSNRTSLKEHNCDDVKKPDQENPIVSDEIWNRAMNEEKRRQKGRGWIFTALVALLFTINFDNGILPASLQQIGATFNISFSTLGLMGSLVYIGVLTSCPMMGYLLSNIKHQRLLLALALFLNVGCVFAFSLAPASDTGVKILLTARTFIGFTQAPLVIFAPVWADEYAPSHRATLWMGIIQGCCVIGIMVGYVISASLTSSIGLDGWRYALIFQACCLFPFVFLFVFVPDRYLNTKGATEEERIALIALELMNPKNDSKKSISLSNEKNRKQFNIDPNDFALEMTSISIDAIANNHDNNSDAHNNDNGDAHNNNNDNNSDAQNNNDNLNSTTNNTNTTKHTRSSSLLSVQQAMNNSTSSQKVKIVDSILDLLSNGVWVLLTIALTALFFVSTGIQFWSTDYMISVLQADSGTVFVSFAATAITAPVAGVFAGGWLVDRCGGYKDNPPTHSTDRSIHDHERNNGVDDDDDDDSSVIESNDNIVENTTNSTTTATTNNNEAKKDKNTTSIPGQNTFYAMLLCSGFGFGAVLFAHIAAFPQIGFGASIACVWFVLFWGGALLPAATGLCMAVVPADLRPLSYSISMCSYNLLGYAGAPFLCGVVAESLSLEWGWRLVMFVSSFALIPMLAATLIAYKRYTRNHNDIISKNTQESDFVDLENLHATPSKNNATTTKNASTPLSNAMEDNNSVLSITPLSTFYRSPSSSFCHNPTTDEDNNDDEKEEEGTTQPTQRRRFSLSSYTSSNMNSITENNNQQQTQYEEIEKSLTTAAVAAASLFSATALVGRARADTIATPMILSTTSATESSIDPQPVSSTTLDDTNRIRVSSADNIQNKRNKLIRRMTLHESSTPPPAPILSLLRRKSSSPSVVSYRSRSNTGL